MEKTNYSDESHAAGKQQEFHRPSLPPAFRSKFLQRVENKNPKAKSLDGEFDEKLGGRKLYGQAPGIISNLSRDRGREE